MGTSKRWKGADQRSVWRDGDKALDNWSRGVEPDGTGLNMSDKDANEIVTAYLADLQRTTARASETDPLRQALLAAGSRLPTAIELISEDLRTLVASPQPDIDAIASAAETFVNALGANSGTLVDAILRRGAAAAVQEAIQTLSADPGDEASSASAGPLGESLFCLLYRLFFAHAVAQVITTVIAEKVKLAVPVLYVLDPTGVVADWVAKRVFSLLPNPCHAEVDDGGSPQTVFEDLARESVDRALGIDQTVTAGARAS